MDTSNDSLPTHVGIILDGNRRWAKEHGLTTLEGHKKGYDNLKEIGTAAANKGIKYLSAYVFSTENWNRQLAEVDYLMKLLVKVCTQDTEELNRENIRVRVAGSREKLTKVVTDAIESAEEKTKNNDKATLILCLNYGGQQEITDAANELIASGQSSPFKPEDIAKHLYLPDVPAIDLVIRTSGEHRISNFMLWRAAYSELYFTNKNWPDFSVDDLEGALADYARRTRRYGK